MTEVNLEEAQERIQELTEALLEILDTHRIDVIKEIASQVLDLDTEEYEEDEEYMYDIDDMDELDLNMEMFE